MDVIVGVAFGPNMTEVAHAVFNDELSARKWVEQKNTEIRGLLPGWKYGLKTVPLLTIDDLG